MEPAPNSVQPLPLQPIWPAFFVFLLLSDCLVLLTCLVGFCESALAPSPAAPAPQAQNQVQAASSTAKDAITAQTASTTRSATTTGFIIPKGPEAKHVPLPAEVRGFYWTGWTAGSKRVDELLAYAVASHLNTIVIDMKIDDGTLSFKPRDPQLGKYAPKYPAIRDLDALLDRLREKGLYRIARIFIMRDEAFGTLNPDAALRNADGSLWRDKKGTPWLDPAAPQVADYAIELAREAYARGFDEVQFDYLRFPSDGHLSAIKYPVYDGKLPMARVMRELFKKIGGDLRQDNIPVSFDLFGLVCCAVDDLGIGQRLSDAYPFADAVSPMMYPSHYADGFQGFAKPADHPYEVVKQSLDQALAKLKADDPQIDMVQARKKMRPWIQDFNIGAAYDADKIQAQIKAVRDAGASGWLIWNARNVYTPARYLK